MEVKGQGEKIYCFGRNEQKEPIIVTSYGHRPYFYVNDDCIVPNNEKIVSIEQGHTSIFKNKVKKIILLNSNDVSFLRTQFELGKTHEDDILYHERWTIDTKIKNGIETDQLKDVYYTSIKPIEFYVDPRRLHLDIEVIMGEGGKLPDWELANRRITAISCVDSYTKIVHTFVNRPDFKGKLDKAVRIDNNTMMYKESSPENKQIETEITTESGSKYKWILHFIKSQLLVTFTDSSLKEIESQEPIEYNMMNAFLDLCIINRYDFYNGWNIKQFDAPYLVNRMKKLKIDYTKLSPIDVVTVSDEYYRDIVHIKGVEIFDTMLGYLKMHTHKVSGGLNDAAKSKLGYGKVKHADSLDDLIEHDLEKFCYYNATDVIAEYEIFEKMKMMQYFSGLKKFIGVHYDKMFDNSSVIDYYFLCKAREHNIVLPSARLNKSIAKSNEKNDTESSYSGGAVPIPLKYGRTFNILTLDFKSLYPCIMISLNLGNDTYIKEKTSENEDLIVSPEVAGRKHYFRRDIISFVSECLKELVDFRDNLKDQLYQMKKQKGKYTDYEIDLLKDMQTVVKFLTNTIYGVFGFASFRLHDKIIAEIITTFGRLVLLDSMKFIEEVLKIKVHGGDTDSSMSILPSLSEISQQLHDICIKIFTEQCDPSDYPKFNELEQVYIGLSFMITSKLNNYYQHYTKEFNMKYNYLKIKPEDISSVFFNVKLKSKGNEEVERAAKKRYAKRKWIEFVQDKPIKSNEVEIKGFNRSDLSDLSNMILKYVLDLICKDNITNEQIKDMVQKYLFIIIKQIRELKYPVIDLCRQETMSKRINNYGNDEHARAARWTNKHAYLWKGRANLDKGSTVKFIFVNGNNLPNIYERTDVIALDDSNYLPPSLFEYIDFNKIINKMVLEPLSEILSGLEISHAYLNTGKEEESMF